MFHFNQMSLGSFKPVGLDLLCQHQNFFNGLCILFDKWVEVSFIVTQTQFPYCVARDCLQDTFKIQLSLP